GSAQVAGVAGGAGAAAELCTPTLAITVDAACRVVVRDADGHVLVDDGDDGGLAIDGDGAGVTLRRRALASAHYYGLGERTAGLELRGGAYTLWSTDAYDPALGGWRPDADPLYQSIPFVAVLDGGVAHGELIDDTRRLGYDLAAADPTRATVHTPAGAIVEYVIAGPSLREVARRHTAITGRTPLPPRWALGYQQSRWGYAPASRLTDLATTFRDRGVAADGLWLDIQHLDGFRTFTWDPATFADPAALTAALAADDFALTVIADPGIKVDPGWAVYDGGVAGDHFLRDDGGAIYQGVVWPGPAAFPDFTRAATRAWWGAQVGQLAALGVRGIWLDVNEPTTFPEGGGGASVPDLPVAGDPGAAVAATMDEVHDVYAVLEAQATWEGLRAAAPARRPFVLSRAGASGIQRWAAVWTGDAVSSWDGLGRTLPMLLGMGVSGVPFVGSDVGGYSGGATPELFARWLAVGAVSPFCRGHVTTGVPDQEPWAFGAEVEEISRRLLAERYRRLPYLYSLFAEAEASGAPVLRPLVFEFQDDPATATLDDEAMLGPWLLVAPVVEAGATTRAVYLPAGRWLEARSGAVVVGPTTIDVDVTLQALPTFVRAGAIVPQWRRGAAIAHTGGGAGGAPGDVLQLDVVPDA
ncbi:MAG: alpha-glucosidase, partial [Myxococcales bacterium]|nr:alpha-glucosidase [Myxococcales bacterium]